MFSIGYNERVQNLTKRTPKIFRIAQMVMERAMFGLAMRDIQRTAWIRAKTTVK